MLKIFLSALLIALAVGSQGMVQAQTYPTRPVRIVVPFPPGGPTDIVARMVAGKLSQAYGQAFVVENRPGAGSTVGTQTVAQAPADGYTLLLASTSSLAMAPGLYKNPGYDPRKSFSAISLLSSAPQLIVVNAGLPVQDLTQLIALAKEKPDALMYGSAGNGTPPHIAAEMFKSLTGTQLLHVPYKGGGPALMAVASGEVQLLFEGSVTVLPQIKAGKLRALAVAGPQRLVSLPDVPTVREAGLPAFQVNFWSGLVAPAGTSPEIVASLNATLRKALASPDALETFAKLGLTPSLSSAGEFSGFIDSEITRWGKVIQSSGARVD